MLGAKPAAVATLCAFALASCANSTTSNSTVPDSVELSPEAAAERQRAEQRKAREEELLEIVASANLVAMPDSARGRIRAITLGEVAQLRFEASNFPGSLEAIDLAIEASEDSGDPKLAAPLARTRYLILRYTALDLAKRGQLDQSLKTFDRLTLLSGLTAEERAQIGGDRLLILELKGDQGDQARDRVIRAALARILAPAEGSPPSANATPSPVSMTDDLDAERIRLALSQEIGKEVAQAALPAASDTPTTETGAMDQGEVLRVVSQNKKSISACYSQSLRGGTGQRGKLELRVTIEPSGSVGSVRIQSEQFKANALGRCIADTVARWKFPPFSGASREIELPFVLDYLN